MARPVLRLCFTAGTVALALLAACSLILDTAAEQCSTDADCTNRGPKFAGTRCSNKVCVADEGGVTDSGGDAFDPQWGCLGRVKAPTFPKPMVNVSVPLVDLVTQMPVTKIDAKVCSKTDVSCAMPIGPVSNPSAQGILTFTLPAGFDGYVDMKSTMVSDAGLPAYLPSLVFFNPPLSDDIIYLTIPLVSPQALGLLAAQFGNTIDMTLGGPFAAINDCQGKPAAGASIAIDKDTDASRTFYFVNGLPTESATQTDKTGYSGFINIPTGIRNMSGFVADGGALIGKVSVLVRPSTLTYTVLPPTP
jgi:hypothetical protein